MDRRRIMGQTERERGLRAVSASSVVVRAAEQEFLFPFFRSDIMKNDNMQSGVIPLNRITLNVNDRLADAFRTLGFVPPSPAALHPWDGEHVEEALCAYAYAVARATAEVESIFDRTEWALMADVLNGHCRGAYGAGSMPFLPSQELIASNVCDGHTLNGTGEKWFGADADRRVEELLRKIGVLQPVQADAVVAAIAHFWERTEEIDDARDEWWTLSHRKTLAPRRTLATV